MNNKEFRELYNIKNFAKKEAGKIKKDRKLTEKEKQRKIDILNEVIRPEEVIANMEEEIWYK